MNEEINFYCPECGTILNQGEINRINSGIDIACQVCGTEINGKEQPEPEEEITSNETTNDDLGVKIKKGIQTFVKKVKEFAEELDGNKKKPSNAYSDE